MDNDKEQTEQDETDTYLRTSMEEGQEPSTWEEYGEEEPLEGYDKDEPFEENDDEGKWTTQFSYPTEEEENTLFIAFMTGNDEETRKREKEILDRIIPTEIMDLDEPFEEEDEEETDDLSECQPYDLTEDQEEDFTDEFIDKDKEDEDIQLLESLTVPYRNHEKQDEETTHPLSSTTKFDDQLIGTRYFTEPDKCWGYDNEHIKDKDKWEMAKTNRMLFEPTVICSSPYSPTTSQIKMNEIFQNQKSDYQTVETKEEQDTENTRRSRDNDLFTEPEDCTSWMTGTKYIGLLNPENQLQTGLMKLNGIDEWPTPTMTKKVKSFLGFENFNTDFTQNDEDLIKPHNKQDENEQDNRDMVKLPEGSSPDLLDHEFDDKRAFEIDDEQFDPIKTLSVREPKTLHNHFSKVAAATSVNDDIAVNVTNMDRQKYITMARIVNDMINSLSGRRPNIWKDIFKDWLIWIPRLPNKNTALTNHSTLRHSKPIQILNGKQTRWSLFLS